MVIHLCAVHGCFVLPQQSGVFATQTEWPTKLEVFIWPFTERVADFSPCTL